MFDDDTERTYDVVRNEEEQYSIWPVTHRLPAGWTKVGVTGTKTKCLRHVSEVWTDLRPRSIRRAADR